MNKPKNKTAAAFIVAVLVIFAWNLGYKQALNSLIIGEDLSASPAEISEETSSASSGSEDTAESQDGTSLATFHGESVRVEDQAARMEVKVSSLALTEIGWVGVRDRDGRVLGAGRFEAGSFKNVTVPLLRATVAGESYQILLYVDDGDKEFDLHKDILISGPSGGVAGTNFNAL